MKNLTRLLKPLLFLSALLPAAWLLYAALTGNLGANPIEAITRSLGEWALRFLLLTLSITPLRKLTGRRTLLRYRRMLGLYAFFYAVLHLLSYIVLDQFFYWPEIGADILKRPYITVGMLSFLLLIPLAITSTKGWIRRLGRGWRQLHRIVYPAAIGGVLHFYMLVKADTREALIYGAILGVLLLARLDIGRDFRTAQEGNSCPPKNRANCMNSCRSKPS